MFVNIQNINVPFISAYDIHQYTDNVGLTITTTGAYIILPFGSDDFKSATTGTTLFVSGYGYWQGSGFSFQPLLYFYDNYEQYQTGYYSGTNYLLSGSLVNGYNINYPSFINENFSLNNIYSFDDFESYSTGIVTKFLNSGTTISGYNTLFPNFYNNGIAFNIQIILDSGTPQTGLYWNFLGTLSKSNTANYNQYPNQYDYPYNSGIVGSNFGYFYSQQSQSTSITLTGKNFNTTGITGDFTIEFIGNPSSSDPKGLITTGASISPNIAYPLVDFDYQSGIAIYAIQTGGGLNASFFPGIMQAYVLGNVISGALLTGVPSQNMGTVGSTILVRSGVNLSMYISYLTQNSSLNVSTFAILYASGVATGSLNPQTPLTLANFNKPLPNYYNATNGFGANVFSFRMWNHATGYTTGSNTIYYPLYYNINDITTYLSGTQPGLTYYMNCFPSGGI